MANCSSCGRKLPPFSFGKRLCAWCVQHEAAQRGELPDDARQPVMPVPWQRGVVSSMMLTHALVGINVVIYLAMSMAGGSFSDPSPQLLVRWGANYGPLTLSGEWWRLITYNFLHIGLLHIGFNMWCLWDLGALCESLYGTWMLGALYLITGVAGGITSIGLHPARLSAGASGAIFGLAGALLAGYYLGEFSMPRPMVQAHLRSIFFFVIYNVAFGVVSGSTDNSAHFGGLAAGIILGALIVRMAPSHDDLSARFVIVALAVLALAGITYGLERSHSYVLHARRGSELLEQNRLDEAIPELQTAVRMKPSYVQAHLDLANAYYTKQRFAQAESELKSALALDPGNDNAAYYLGFVYLGEEHPRQAREVFARLAAKDSSFAGAHYGLGMSLAAEGDQEAAIQEYQTTINMRPEFEGVHYHLGMSQAKIKQYDAAIKAFEQEQQIGDDYENESALADAYEAKGLREKAAEARGEAEKMKGK
jgi:rhomboid protease GluP